MKEIKILLNSVEKIIEFVNIMERLSINADLGQGSVHVDARSMIGVMAMDTKNPITLKINESDDVVNDACARIDAFIVK